MDINKIISILRDLREDGAVVAVPTNNTGSGPSGAGYGGTAQGFTPKNAGYDKVMNKLMRRRGPVIGLGKGSHNRWKKPQP
jgi:hypothetical protein